MITLLIFTEKQLQLGAERTLADHDQKKKETTRESIDP